MANESKEVYCYRNKERKCDESCAAYKGYSREGIGYLIAAPFPPYPELKPVATTHCLELFNQNFLAHSLWRLASAMERVVPELRNLESLLETYLKRADRQKELRNNLAILFERSQICLAARF